ncbi:beta-ketoacyl-[acyl-carrier-protein] synthase family protein [Luteimonas notoginsengisoli]|uniref:Nodulation protein E n=1 Tax=Luteimonas notoginsengisoli TaxID=1578200 RepID=A0ABV7URA9_9GAMM
MKKEAVAITGVGVLSPIGLDVEGVVDALRTARSGIDRITTPPTPREFAAGVVKQDFADAFTRLELPFLDRCQQLAIVSARQALLEAGIEDFSDFGQRAGLYYGNVNGGAAATLEWSRQLLVEGKQAARPFAAMAIMSNAGAAQIAIRHKIFGPVVTHASACGSSGVALGEAARAIADGYLDVAVAGGAEAPLTAGVLGVFSGTRAMSGPDGDDVSRTCKPFSRDRTGLVLGEGAAFVVLEAASHAERRGATIHGYLTGYGISSDAHHIGMPAAEGQVRSLQAALDHARLQPRDIGYLNAHATATDGGDVIESAAIRAVFGDGDDATRVSSTKAVHGHLLGATSALEFVITLLSMRNRVLPASAHMGEMDPRCKLNHVGPVPLRDVELDHALSFSCGFGGTNVALIVSRNPG